MPDKEEVYWLLCLRVITSSFLLAWWNPYYSSGCEEFGFEFTPLGMRTTAVSNPRFLMAPSATLQHLVFFKRKFDFFYPFFSFLTKITISYPDDLVDLFS